MRFLCVILFLFAVTIPAFSQVGTSPNALINAFYSAMEAENEADRSEKLKELFLEEGTMNTVIQRTSFESSLKQDKLDGFLDKSKTFYDGHSMNYDEIERSIDYYADMALVHSLVFQTIIEKNRPKVTYEQFLWFGLSMVYENDRWYLTNVSWINAFGDEDINQSMNSDTLWHRMSD